MLPFIYIYIYIFDLIIYPYAMYSPYVVDLLLFNKVPKLTPTSISPFFVD